MSFNIFGPATKNDIRVGYISTERGFVDGVSVCEANDYAKKNPGTQFVFRTRDQIQYLNINEVNGLTPDNLLPNSSKDCPGIEFETNCGPSKVYFYGGGGVGAKANPIIGQDGSLLAVDLVSGGFGYQYAPVTVIKDNCSVGAGVVVRSVVGEIVETVEYYDQEDDFEDYEICDPTDVIFGRIYSPDGKDIGVWDPTLYANFSKDPIRREILEYQKFLASLQGGARISSADNTIKKWWTTRTEVPLSVTSLTRTTRVKHDVTDQPFRDRQIKDGVKPEDTVGWGIFMNSHAISPTPQSNVPGTDYAGITFTMEWEKEFPYDGEYTFRGMADNIARIYFDNQLLFTTTKFRDPPPDKVKKNISEGVHRIRVDLFNIPITEKGSKSQSQQSKRIFNTVDYIGKANRQLWRTNVYGRGGFLNENGISPFDTTVQLQDNPYAGTHRIVWDNVDFPVDGNYVIELEVDDNVTLTLQGPNGETVINKRGFSGSGQSTGKSVETRSFNKGKYRIIADLEQIPGGQFGFSDIKGINPMALAINIESVDEIDEVISKKSWNENPMGVALVIDAPLPPIPQEPVPEQEGRCPNNPIWTTRFPGASNKWNPVRFDPTRWSQFMNRYAISPVLPLAQRGSDGGGIIYRNSWNLDIPYDGFYALRGTVDNGGRVLIDGKEIARGGGLSFRGRSSGRLDGFGTEDPFTNKIFLTRGIHSIEVEVENQKTETFELINQKVFDTKDWAVSHTPPPDPAPAQGQREEWVKIDDVFVPPKYQSLGGGRGPFGSVGDVVGPDASFHRYNEGTFYRGKKIRSGGDWNDTNVNNNYIQFDENTRLTLGSYHPGAGQRFGIAVWKKKTINTQSAAATKLVNASTNSTLTKGGVTYSGPELATYRNGALGPFLTPAFNGDDDYRANNMGRTWTLTWNNVDFPVDGQYTLRAEADDYVIVRIDGIEVGKAQVFEGVRTFNFNVSRGKRKVEMELYNIPGNDTSTFETNPVVFNAIITVPVNQKTNVSKSWLENPVGISAVLIPPPCPKRVRGKGVITEVIVDDPGNGNPSFPNNVPPATVATYPVTLRLKSVIVENPGINHNCGVDEIQITPSNGAVLSYDCDSFGRIRSVKVLDPGLGFTSYPDITMVTDTGVNARFRPQFEVVRDPIVIDEAKLIQVTDLVGLKQTGYVDGRSYFGAVFYKDGVRYAGFYETPGELVQVYDTLQESIDAQVVTQPSAILRQGTDTNSNNPRLNLPGTPDNLI